MASASRLWISSLKPSDASLTKNTMSDDLHIYLGLCGDGHPAGCLNGGHRLPSYEVALGESNGGSSRLGNGMMTRSKTGTGLSNYLKHVKL